MKKFITLLLAMLMGVFCLGLAACGDNGNDSNDDGNNEKPVLKVYTNAGFAPYEYINKQGKVVGVDIDVMNAIGEKLGYEVIINDIKFEKILDEVQRDEFAIGAAGMTKTEERDAIALSSVPYATSVQYVIVPKGAFDESDLVDGKLEIAKLKELENKAIGFQEGTTGSFMVCDAVDGIEEEDGSHTKGELEGVGASYVSYTNAIVASQDIGTTVGAVIIDKLPAKSIVSANSDKLECIELKADPEQYVLYLNKNATELLADINEILAEMIADGTIDNYTIAHSNGNA